MPNSHEDESNVLKLNLNKLYEKDKVLKSIKEYEDQRKNLIKSSLDEKQLEELNKLKTLLSNKYIEKAFSSEKVYKTYSDSIIKYIDSRKYDQLQEQLYKSINSYLKEDYKQTIQATRLLSEKLKSLNGLGLSDWSNYNSKLTDSINLYDTDRLKASQGLLGLTSMLNSDVLKAKVNATEGLGSITKALDSVYNPKLEEVTTATKGLASLAKPYTPITEGLGQSLAKSYTPVTEGLGSITKALDSVYNPKLGEVTTATKGLASLTRPIDNITIHPPKGFEPFKIPRVQDSPSYKQNERLITKSEEQIKVIEEMLNCLHEMGEKQENQSEKINIQNEKQIELMAEIALFMDSQRKILESDIQNQEKYAKKLEEQNNIIITSSTHQIESLKEVSGFLASQSDILEVQRQNQELQNQELKKQNETMERQIKNNDDSSSRALLIAWAGIAIAIVTALLGVFTEFHIYNKEDHSDNLNHKELKDIIKNNNNQELVKELIEQINLQNQKLESINESFKDQSINQKLFIKELKMQNQNIQKVVKENNNNKIIESKTKKKNTN